VSEVHVTAAGQPRAWIRVYYVSKRVRRQPAPLLLSLLGRQGRHTDSGAAGWAPGLASALALAFALALASCLAFFSLR
jgi:hypothetical protein